MNVLYGYDRSDARLKSFQGGIQKSPNNISTPYKEILYNSQKGCVGPQDQRIQYLKICMHKPSKCMCTKIDNKLLHIQMLHKRTPTALAAKMASIDHFKAT